MTKQENKKLDNIKRLYLGCLLSGLFMLNGPLIFSIESHASHASNTYINSIPNKDAVRELLDSSNNTSKSEYKFMAIKEVDVMAETLANKTTKAITIPEISMKVEDIPLYDVTPEERETLARLVELEAGNQTIEERAKVVKVVFNRLEDGKFGDNITEVVFAPHQFTPSPRIPDTIASEKSYKAVDAVIWGDIDLSDFDCLFFHGDGKKNYFRKEF